MEHSFSATTPHLTELETRRVSSPVHPGIGLLWMGVRYRRRRGFPYKHLIAKKTVSNLKAKKMKKDNNL